MALGWESLSDLPAISAESGPVSIPRVCLEVIGRASFRGDVKMHDKRARS